MGLAIGGLFIMALPVGLASWLAVGLRREGKSIRPAVRYLSRSGSFYMGLLLIAMTVSGPLGEFVLLVLFVLLAAVAIRLLLRLPGAIRGLPASYRNIGDPAAWRGER
jgi:hypothetical protein